MQSSIRARSTSPTSTPGCGLSLSPQSDAIVEKTPNTQTQTVCKTDVRIIDFLDTGHPALLRMWDKPQRRYRAMGYRIDSGAPSVGRFEW
ncbi:hypothetical protein [Ottowia caeni]|uniref:hypothetical protein n=1 Tax=Ottowia caeni TaxID=2870339 RepID=UPI003D729DC2